jgi:hypothetical protein
MFQVQSGREEFRRRKALNYIYIISSLSGKSHTHLLAGREEKENGVTAGEGGVLPCPSS